MQNAAVGVRRLFVRLRTDSARLRSSILTNLGRRGIARISEARVRLASIVGRGSDPLTSRAAHRAAEHPASHQAARPVSGFAAALIRTRRSLSRIRRESIAAITGRVHGTSVRERALPIGVATLVLVASAFSVSTGASAAGGTGSTEAGGNGPRIAIGGDDGGIGGADQQQVDPGTGDTATSTPVTPALDQPDPVVAPIQGPFLDDGTLLMPVAVDTTVADGSAKLTPYKVKSGDTLTGIAHHFGVSMMSVWWANSLTSKDKLHVGQTLMIPPVSGLVITVAATDTLDSIAARTGATGDEILAYNDLTDPNLVIGQKLIIPGAIGKAIKEPAPTPPATHTSGGGGSSGGGGTYHPPSSTYSGGTFAWPVPGGYISQYFHYSHPALDIAAPYGSRIVAAAPGTVIFAGWKSNGGGYQVWVSHGSNLYTGYYHMSSISVGIGEHVGRGSQVGRVGQSGAATGPHCHFEVWRGYPWENSSYRVNPLGYL